MLALNASKFVLPTVLLLILDNKYLKEENFGDKQMPYLVEQLIISILNTVKTRKKQLHNSYWADHEPRIVLLRPMPRPAYSLVDPQKYKTIRRSYSREMEAIANHYRVTFLNIDELNCSQRVLFDDFGDLSPYGTERLWKSISDFFRRADREEYYAIKKYRTTKKSVATQTFTQQSTLNDAPINQHHSNNNAAGDNAQPMYHHQHNYHNQPYQYQYGVNDHYHINNNN